MSIALVIPSYNRADLIGETIRSALAQTLPFAEIVVVDDGSTDHTPTVLDGFGAQIRVIRTANQGVQEARNTGIRATTAALVALCDSDDLLEPGFVRKTVTWMGGHPAVDALYCNFVLFDANGDLDDKLSSAPAGYFDGAACDEDVWFDIPDLYARNLGFQPLFPSGSVFRRAFLTRLGSYNPAFRGVGAEDWEFTLRAIGEGRVAVAREPLARVRRHVGNDSANGLYMLRGEVQILAYALAHHRPAVQHEALIRAEIDKRTALAFDAAFARGELALAHGLAARLQSRARDRRFAMKRWICGQPAVMAQLLWRLTQVGRRAPERAAHTRQP